MGHLLDEIDKVEEKNKLAPDSIDGRFCRELKTVFKQTIDAWNEYRRGMKILQDLAKEKGKILDEFTKVVGCHRKAAIRLLHRDGSRRQGKRLGCRCRYGHEVVDALRRVWEASDRLCSKRLQPFLGEMVKVIRQHGEPAVNAGMEAELCRMSPSAIDRVLGT